MTQNDTNHKQEVNNSAANPQEPPNQKTLKIVVIVLGVLIVFALIAFVYGIARTLKKKEPEPTGISSPMPPVQSDTAVKIDGFGDLDILLPRGAVIQDVDLVGNRLLVRYRSSAKDHVMIFDLTNKQTVGTLHFKVGE